MFKGVFWIIAIVVLQVVVAALAKRAQANAQAAKQGTTPAPPAPASGSSTGAPRVLARGAAKQKPAKNSAMRAPKAPQRAVPAVAAAASERRGGDSADAMLSRQHLAERVAQLKAAEARVADASGIRAKRVAAPKRVAPTLSAAEVVRSLRNPREIQKALILGEILGRPRALS